MLIDLLESSKAIGLCPMGKKRMKDILLMFWNLCLLSIKCKIPVLCTKFEI